MRYRFVHAKKALYPLTVLCRVLKVSRSGYYAWSRRPVSKRELDDEVLGVEVAAIHEESRRTYGSPRVHAELRARGKPVSRKRVARLMRKRGLEARPKRRFRRTTDSDHAQPIAPNLLDRNFIAVAPNQKWVTDITYIRTWEGWLYLATVLDLFSRRIVGLGHRRPPAHRARPRRLNMALGRRLPETGWCTTPTAAASTPAATTPRRSRPPASSAA